MYTPIAGILHPEEVAASRRRTEADLDAPTPGDMKIETLIQGAGHAAAPEDAKREPAVPATVRDADRPDAGRG